MPFSLVYPTTKNAIDLSLRGNGDIG